MRCSFVSFFQLGLGGGMRSTECHSSYSRVICVVCCYMIIHCLFIHQYPHVSTGGVTAVDKTLINNYICLQLQKSVINRPEIQNEGLLFNIQKNLIQVDFNPLSPIRFK